MAANLYYDDQQRLIATTDAELVIFFKSLPGVTAVQNLPFRVGCPMVALYQVQTSGILPKFISKNGVTPKDRIYLKSLPANNISLSALCNGATYTTPVQPPEIGAATSINIDYYVEVDGVTIYTSPSGEYYQYI